MMCLYIGLVKWLDLFDEEGGFCLTTPLPFSTVCIVLWQVFFYEESRQYIAGKEQKEAVVEVLI